MNVKIQPCILLGVCIDGMYVARVCTDGVHAE